ncbi:MAG: glycosyltransferase family 4 protein [Candidatus Buchananbacteria bacterium]|nr:glycosyltransferase family 4 protein [Candidatus Buchananbacteria bacterium]
MPIESRVLIFTTAYRPLVGGSEIALEEIIRRLPNVFFDILTPRYKTELERIEYFDNGCIHRVGFGSPMDKLFFPISGFLLAIKFSPKHIHAYQASFGAGAAFIYKTFFPKTRFILTLQEGKDLYKQNFLIKYFRDLIIRKADVVTVISHYLANYAKKINPKAELHMISNGVDLDKFRHMPNSDENTVITVSRLVPKNGVGDIVKAVGLVKRDIADVRLIIVGSGPLEKEIRQSVKDLDLEDRVIMAGSQSLENVAGYLAKAKVFVRPSLSEGLGSAFLEAMAVGLPVIGTAVGGIPDFLKDGETGLFCKVADPKDLAEKIVRILKDEQLREKITINARALIVQKYDWNIIANEFAKIYERI